MNTQYMSIKILKTIVFGINDYAELAHYYLTHDSPYQPVAFCVDREYWRGNDRMKGLPILLTEEIGELNREDYNMFIPMSASKMNNDRKDKYEQLKKAGWKFINYISSRATVLTEDIGENNFILENNVIQPFVKIGDNNTFWSGNHIGHHSLIQDHCTFTSHVVLSGHCHVMNNCFFGVNSTIRDHLLIAENTLVSQGANILKQTMPDGVYVGNPAKMLEGKRSGGML